MLKHDGDGDMPRIYFYLSGKSVPLNSIGGSGSPVGTQWIILDLLQERMPVLRSFVHFQSRLSRKVFFLIV